MNELDDISRLLGGIEAKQEISILKTERVEVKVDNIAKSSDIALNQIKEQGSRIELLERDYEKEVLPTVKEFRKLKERGVGIFAAFTIFCTFISFIITKLAKFLHLAV